MNKLKNVELLNSLFMSSEEINFVLLDPAFAEASSEQQKQTVRSEMESILKNDLTGTLLLPFIKPDYR
jgi:hypothetical protein